MLIYVNGDSHSAGAEIGNDYCFAKDDPEFIKTIYYSPDYNKYMNELGKMPHKDGVGRSYGKKLADMLEGRLVCDAQSGASNARILRTTQEYIEEYMTPHFVMIGWTTWDREEWELDGEVYQISASGEDNIPDKYQEAYKQWVAQQTHQRLIEKERYWHEQIWEFHNKLKRKGIRHLFFNTFSCFDHIDNQKQWGNNYFHPYENYYTFYNYLRRSNHEPNENYHFDSAAHTEWANVMFDKFRFV